jgi:hypothetical protein
MTKCAACGSWQEQCQCLLPPWQLDAETRRLIYPWIRTDNDEQERPDHADTTDPRE